MNCQVTAESVREWFKADASVLQCQPIEAIAKESITSKAL